MGVVRPQGALVQVGAATPWLTTWTSRLRATVANRSGWAVASAAPICALEELASGPVTPNCYPEWARS